MSIFTAAQLLERASKFTLLNYDRAKGTPDIYVERRRQRDGTVKWALYQDGMVFYRSDRQWGSESLPSSRGDKELAETRFDTLDEALAAGQAEVDLFLQLGQVGYWENCRARFEAAAT